MTVAQQQSPIAFHIGAVPVHGRLILAPMAGFSDLPFRVICREHGSALSYTPCITDVAVTHGGMRTERLSEFLESERPVAVQLLGADERSLLQAAERDAATARHDRFEHGVPCAPGDQRGRGAALLCEPPRIAIWCTLTNMLPVPVTGKIRLGWDASSRNYLEVARLLEDNGIAASLCTGARERSNTAALRIGGDCRGQGCGLSSRHRQRGRAYSVDADRMRDDGCDGVMVGRGAVGNPWIFGGRSIDAVGYPERLAVIRRHALWMSHFYGEPLGIVLIRKHVVRYVQGCVMRHRCGLRCWQQSAGELFRVLDGWSPDLSRPELPLDQSEAEDSYGD